MRSQLLMTLAAVVSILAAAFSATAGATKSSPAGLTLLPPLPKLPPLAGSWQPINNLTSVAEIADFAVTTHNRLVPVHQVKLVSLDKAASRVVVPKVNVVYQLFLTTVDGSAGVGVGKQQFKVVVGVVSSSAGGQSVKTLLSFLPQLI